MVDLRQFLKTADPQMTTDQWNQMIHQAGLRRIAELTVGGIGGGAALRGIQGFLSNAKRDVYPTEAKYPGAVITQLPLPDDDDKKEQKFAQVVPPVAATPEEAPVTNYQNTPWFYPGVAAGVLGGVYGGYKGMDWLVNRLKKKDDQTAVQDAQKDFETAIRGGYANNPAKTAAEKCAGQQLGEALDELYDAYEEKRANGFMDWWHSMTPADFENKFPAYYGTYAALTGIPTGLMAYNRAQRNSRSAALNKAMQMRIQREYTKRPSEILAEGNSQSADVPDASDDTNAQTYNRVDDLMNIGPRKITTAA